MATKKKPLVLPTPLAQRRSTTVTAAIVAALDARRHVLNGPRRPRTVVLQVAFAAPTDATVRGVEVLVDHYSPSSRQAQVQARIDAYEDAAVMAFDRDATHGRKFPRGSTKDRLAWQQAVAAFAATRPEAGHRALLQAVEHGAVPTMRRIPNDRHPTCTNITRTCAHRSHFHFDARDTVSRDQVQRYLRRLRPQK